MTNNNKRYYYTDPLAAAWMGEKYDMEFQVSEHGHFELGILVDEDNLFMEEWCEDEHFYIHPDSLHLLEPKVGDVISGLAGGGKLYNRIIQEVVEGAEENAAALISKGCAIIQRNGIAFIWPESE